MKVNGGCSAPNGPCKQTSGRTQGSRELLEALPRHETAHAALPADILDTLRGSSVTPAERPAPLAQELSPSELRVLLPLKRASGVYIDR